MGGGPALALVYFFVSSLKYLYTFAAHFVGYFQPFFINHIANAIGNTIVIVVIRTGNIIPIILSIIFLLPFW